MTAISLPFPPSTNNLFVNRRGGRSISKDYRAWLDEAGWKLIAQRPARHVGRVDVLIELKNPSGHRRDADNRIKAVLDLLVKHQVIPNDDDHTVREVTARWVDDGEPCVVTVGIAGAAPKDGVG